MVNVNREITDQFYRYKMPKIIAKVEGKGNGIKTVIVNMPDVAKAIGRPPTYPTKYFGCELGAQTQFDAKNERYIVNGSHDPSKLQDLLDGFIKRFVLCPECDNPETQLNISAKKGLISQHCIACGHSNQVDLRHKVTTFIIKNPPGEEPSMTAATPNKKSTVVAGSGGHKKSGKKNGEVSPEAGNGDSAPILPKRVCDDADDDDVDWGEDVSDAAVQARRMEELSGAVSSMVVTDDLEKTPSERVDIFYAYVKFKKAENKLTGVENEKNVVGEAERLDIKDKAPLVLAELLLDTEILTQIKTFRGLFLRFTHENPKAQKYLLGGFELLVGDVYKEDLMSKTVHVLKQFYDNDILDEETLIEWANKGPSKKYVKKDVSKQIHESVATFINWLKEADEETSEEEEEEDDVEVVYSHTGKVGTETINTKLADSKADEEDEEEEDFDIDAI